MEEFQILERENQIWFSLHFNGLLQTQSKNRMVRSWHYGNGKNVCVCVCVFFKHTHFFYKVDNLLRSIFWIDFNKKNFVPIGYWLISLIAYYSVPLMVVVRQ